MKREFKNELNKALSLMERMEQHTTLTETKKEYPILNESKGSFRFAVGPEEFYDLLEGTPKNRFITFGYLSNAKIVVPAGKRLNPATNRMNKFDDYEQLGKNLGVSSKHEDTPDAKLINVIKLSIYNLRWQTSATIDADYSDYKKRKEELAQKYGIEVGKARYQTDKMNFGNNGGISSYAGDNEENKGHTYTNLNMSGVKPISTAYYLVFDDGNIQQIDGSKLEMLPYKSSETIIEKLRTAGATEDEINSLLTMDYRRFEHSHILFFSATPDTGIPTVCVNKNLSNKLTGEANINPEELINIAKDRYGLSQ